jgi:hypothetical protein
LTIFANTTQRKLQFVTRIQLSKNIRSALTLTLSQRERGARELRLTRKISER